MEVSNRQRDNSLLKNQVWELETLPERFLKKPIKCKWIFKVKTDENGIPSEFKGRLVAKGCSQTYFFSCCQILYCKAINISGNTNMNADLSFGCNYRLPQWRIKDIYMEQPEDFISNGNKVCLLKRAMNGLKQASKF